jgi:hypothetical protein
VWLLFLGGQIAAGNSALTLFKAFSVIVVAVTLGGLIGMGVTERVLWRRWPVIEETNERIHTAVLARLAAWRERWLRSPHQD